MVQLWPEPRWVKHEDGTSERTADWALRYWNWDQAMESYPQVPLPGLEINCIGQVALTHNSHGIEVGGPPNAASAAYLVPWGGKAQQVGSPSAGLLEAGRSGESNVTVSTKGDWVHVSSGSEQQSYAMRDPARDDGTLWDVRARHDGDIFVLTVHPAHLECYSGVS